MTPRSSTDPHTPLADVVALAALAWVAAATLHEGMGHGLACSAMGGEPTNWSTFHFGCNQEAMSLWGGRIVAGAGTAVNVTLAALGWLVWRGSGSLRGRLAGWIVFALNGLTTFGYLVFSAIFGIGDWNGRGVMAGVTDPVLARVALAVVGIAGYYAVVRLAAGMQSRMLDGEGAAAQARQCAVIVWMTTGAISLAAALAAGSDWRSTIGASIGVALGGNAGLLSMGRFVKPTAAASTTTLPPSWLLRMAAILGTAAFVAILGPGIAL
ncbi:hypothetical protein [Sphingomonas aurantiaca]|uniref:hypothetical protein n=1 Tax=Sphingomonas aurantiaca TaxID=185949 RepID=UPI003352FA4E